MNKPINFLMLFLVILVILSVGCASESRQKDYEKCTSVCASVLGDDFVTMELCRQDCKEKFLEE